ncbi:MAG: hypothetical protein R3358_08465 [Woeseiaceae bacterium]|nr:hypothetical protein [Woeseiaceae bacterium]
MIKKNPRILAISVLAAVLTLFAGGAGSTGMYGTGSLNGDFIISADGGFVAMTPFAADPLRLNVAMIGRLTFDGNGRATGEWTISFHNAAVPFGVRSRFEASGSYEVAADGHMFMEFEEFRIEPPADNDGIADAAVGFECYIVRRQQEARCVLNTLISFGQGPEPVPEPVTMLGSLERQN